MRPCTEAEQKAAKNLDFGQHLSKRLQVGRLYRPLGTSSTFLSCLYLSVLYLKSTTIDQNPTVNPPFLSCFSVMFAVAICCT